MAKSPAPNRDFATWVNGMRKLPPLLQHALVYSVVEDSPKAFEIRVTGCLWARMFREKDAADIGYAGICHPDFAAPGAFNPKIKLTRTRTLMQGADCCDVRYTVESYRPDHAVGRAPVVAEPQPFKPVFRNRRDPNRRNLLLDIGQEKT